jgi:hypothetical protein
MSSGHAYEKEIQPKTKLKPAAEARRPDTLDRIFTLAGILQWAT